MYVQQHMETNTAKLLRKYNRLEANNDQNEAAKLLVDTFGNEDEQAEIKRITECHNKLGYIEPHDLKKRYEISQKYYRMLRSQNNVDKLIKELDDDSNFIGEDM